MIGSLKGRIIFIAEDYILLETNGVGYMVHITARHVASMALDDAVFLFIHTNVREDAITLYGFENAGQQALFLLLCTVQGVGNKMALNILSAFSTDELRDILIAQDMNSLTRVSGIGKRLGERIVTELKNKTAALERIFLSNNFTEQLNEKGEIDAPSDAPSGAQSDAPIKPTSKPIKSKPSLTNNFIKDATSALENLGYSKADSMRAAVSAKAEGAESLSDIITNALRLLR